MAALAAGVLGAEPQGGAPSAAGAGQREVGSPAAEVRPVVSRWSPEELLRAMAERTGRVHYQGVRRSLGGWPGRAVRVRLFRDGPERLRLEVLGGEEEEEPLRVVVRRGERLYVWSVREPGRWRSRSAGERPRGPWRHLDLLLRNYRVEFVGQEEFLGRPAAVLLLTGKHPGRPQARLWVDLETCLNLKLEKVNPGGERTLGFEFVSLSFPEEMDPALFSVPEGVEEAVGGGPAQAGGPSGRPPGARRRRFASLEELAQAVGRPLLVPRAVPAGFVATEFSLLPGMGVARIGYSDGLSEISLYQSPPKGPGGPPRGAEGTPGGSTSGRRRRAEGGGHPRRRWPWNSEEVQWQGVKMRVARLRGMTFIRRTLSVGEPPVEVPTTVVGEIDEEELKAMSASLGEYRREGAGGAERRGPEAEPTKEER